MDVIQIYVNLIIKKKEIKNYEYYICTERNFTD